MAGGSQLRVKPTTNPLLPATYTSVDAAGEAVLNHIRAGVTGMAFDPRVTENGDQWVAVNGPVAIGGLGPNGTVIPIHVDGQGNLIGVRTLNSTSTALEASRMVKTSAGTLYGFSGYNSKASTQFILVFDYGAGTVPPAGTVPVVIIAVSAASNFSYDPGVNGRTFNAGCWIANSSTAATLTIGSADIWVDAQYL